MESSQSKFNPEQKDEGMNLIYVPKRLQFVRYGSGNRIVPKQEYTTR